MTAGQNLNLIYAVALLALVGSALVAQAVPIGKMLRMAAAWLGIFALLFLVLNFRGELKVVWGRLTGELGMGAGPLELSGSTMVVKKAEDGHFWVRADIAGHNVPFLIDSGATTTSISSDTAKRSGIKVDTSGFPVAISTANGMVEAYRAEIPTMKIGTLTVVDHRAVVSDNFGDFNVLGMNFLSSLKSWKVQGDEMVLEPYPHSRSLP